MDMNIDNDIIKELNDLSDSELTELQIKLKISPDMRIHTSKNPISKLEQKDYIQIPDYKPIGFWYGFGNEWIDWTETAGPDYKGEYIYEVDINGYRIYSRICVEKTNNLKYDGIEINPYIGKAHLDNKTLWYYSWDVASGCIWNLGKVKIELIGLLKNDTTTV